MVQLLQEDRLVDIGQPKGTPLTEPTAEMLSGDQSNQGQKPEAAPRAALAAADDLVFASKE